MNNWKESAIGLEKTFLFTTFADALNFVVQVGGIAEKHNHHPEIHMHHYNQVTLTTLTHETGTVTQKDIDLTVAIDALLV